MLTRSRRRDRVVDLTEREPARVILPGDDEPERGVAEAASGGRPRGRRAFWLIAWSLVVFSAGYAASPDPPLPASPCRAAAAITTPPKRGHGAMFEYRVAFTWNEWTVDCREWTSTAELVPNGGVYERR